MRKQLVLLAGAVTTMVVLAFVVPLFLLVGDLARDRALGVAEREARAIARQLPVLESIPGIEDLVRAVDGATGQRFTVILPDDSVVGAPAPIDELVTRARRGEAFRATVEGGEAVFVPLLQSTEGTVVVRAFVPDRSLTSGVVPARLVLGLLGLALVVVAVLVADRLGRSIVGPVRELSSAAHRLGEGDLEVRVAPASSPELGEVGTAFNRLAGRIANLLSAERGWLADLSHRLRTPLTALRLDAEAIEGEEAAGRLSADIDQLERMVDHVIRQAKRPVREAAGAVTDLSDVVRDRVSFWGVLADEQDRPWSFVASPEASMVRAHREDVAAAVDALLENIFAHTPQGAGFDVAVDFSEQGDPVLIVEDRGSGLSNPDGREQGPNNGGSTGLGLDIVRRTAEASGGDMGLWDRDGGGLRAVVRFGSAARD